MSIKDDREENYDRIISLVNGLRRIDADITAQYESAEVARLERQVDEHWQKSSDALSRADAATRLANSLQKRVANLEVLLSVKKAEVTRLKRQVKAAERRLTINN